VTLRKPDRRPNLAGAKALCDAITGGNGTVEVAHPVTLPGRPVTVHLSAGEVRDYLLATRWEAVPEDAPREKRSDKFERCYQSPVDGTIARIPTDAHAEPQRVLRTTVRHVAASEQRHPLDVAGDIIARRKPAKAAHRDAGPAEWDRDAEEAIRLADAATPDWTFGRLDQGDGRAVVADGPIPLDHIRVSTMWSGGRDGTRRITPGQRDADARFIAAARIGWPRDAARVRALLGSGGKPVERAKRKG
jgi:hypothetical protein